VKLWAGNLPARYAKWKPLKDAGNGNYQTCELAYVEGCGSVKLGYVQGTIKEYPALNCILDPGQGNVTTGAVKFALQSPNGLLRQNVHLNGYNELERLKDL
jgi:hypothetical protein